MRRPLRVLARWLAALGYAGLIFYLSSRPSTGLPRFWFMKYDKVLHAGEYFVFGLLLALALNASGLGLRRACFFAVAMACIYGISDEYHQTFVAGRQGNDLGDLTADTVGAALGSAAYAVGRRAVAR